MHGSLYRRAAYYGVPMLFCLAVHQFALKTWFFQDDFAWLSLRLGIDSPSDLVHALFSPKAEGTVRTLSERLYFLVFPSLFGLNVVPFKVWTFLTELANIALLIQIARRLTGSPLAGFLAAILWTANAGLALALGWSSAYNEIAFAFIILLAFRLLLQYIDTGQRKYWIWQWIVFLLGFGVLELNVVYPALAAAYAWCCARTLLRRTLYLFIPSLLFIAAHFAFIPASSDPHYKMYVGSSPFTMLWTYWAYTLGGMRVLRDGWQPLALGLVVTIAISASMAFFAAMKLRRREWLPLFLLGWFIVVISPVLPLRDHFSEYYVVVPSIGLAILGAWMLASVRGLAAAAAAVLAVLYLTASIADLHMTERYFYARARRMKFMVLGLESLPKTDAGKTILLDGVDNDLFWSGVSDDPFRLLGISRVYLPPGSEALIDPYAAWGGVSRFVISFNDVVERLRNHDVVVLRLEERQLRNVTQAYLISASKKYVATRPGFVDVADPRFEALVGASWYPAEKDYRWMPKAATVKISVPPGAGQMLRITGFCPAAVVAQGPLEVSFRASGIQLGKAILRKPDQSFELSFPVPPNPPPMMEVEIEVNRTTQIAGDSRPLGLVFGTFTIK